jgi:DNA-binding MurR/RpiR family transcriptional regulator
LQITILSVSGKNLPMNFFDRIANRPKNFTQSEQTLVDYLIAHQPHGMLESATGIGKKLGLSASTVVRFFAKMGYASFADAQREARNEISSKLASPHQRINLARGQEHTLESLVENSFSSDIDNIQSTRTSLDMKEFDAIARALTKRRKGGKVYIAGAKNSFGVTHYLHTHLNMCMEDVYMLDAQHSMMADNLLWVNENDVLLAISIRRYAKSVLQAARYFKSTGARVLAITDSPLAPIAGVADHRLLVHTASTSPFDSYAAAFCLCNALIAVLSFRKKKEVDVLLERGEKIWGQVDTFAGKN